MCELLGMSSNHCTTINLSLTVLAERGENPNLHGDGWGVAFYEGTDVRLIKDSGEAKESPWVELIKKQEIQSHDVIAHIRKSTVGEVSYRNTHPFIRELQGRIHTFAHNGTFVGIHEHSAYNPSKFKPVGTTDSEYGFCILMDRMEKIWLQPDIIPSLDQRLSVVNKFAEDMRGLGATNFLYSDGETMFAHGHRRHDPITNTLAWPGLYYIHLPSAGKNSDFEKSRKSGISVKGENDIVTLFASVPLKEGEWQPLMEGETIAVTKGEIIFCKATELVLPA